MRESLRVIAGQLSRANKSIEYGARIHALAFKHGLEVAQRFDLDLPNAFPGHSNLASNLLQCQATIAM